MKARVIEHEFLYQITVFEQKREYQIQILKNGKPGICRDSQAVFNAAEFKMLYPDIYYFAEKALAKHKKANQTSN